MKTAGQVIIGLSGGVSKFEKELGKFYRLRRMNPIDPIVRIARVIGSGT